MSGIGQDGYGPGSGSSADYGYGSGAASPYSSSPFTQPASYGQPAQPSPYGQPSPYAQPASYGQSYGAPQTADPYAGAYPSTVAYSNPTNTMAILSLVFSLAGLVTSGVTCIVGIILGHIARGQIKRTGEQGGGMALSGLIIGYAMIALGIVIILAYILILGFAFAASA